MQNKIFTKEIIIFLILILLLIVSRFLILFFSIEHVLNAEEFFSGSVAKFSIEEHIWPSLLYQAESHWGGSYVISLITIPLFYFFGPNLFSLKLSSLIFSISIFVLLFYSLSRLFNLRIAVFALLLYIFSPASYIINSMVFNGHTEVIFFSILSFYLFFLLDSHKNKNLIALGLGFVCGIGFWFMKTFVATIITIIIFWMLQDKYFFLRKKFFIFMFGFSFGQIQEIFSFLRFHTNTFLYCKSPIFDYFIGSKMILTFKNFLFLLGVDIPNKLFFCNFYYNFYILYFYIFILISFYFLLANLNLNTKKSLIKNHKRKNFFSKETVFFVYFLIFCLILSFDVFYKKKILNQTQVPYKYFSVVVPFIFILIASFCDKLIRSQKKYNIFISFIIFSFYIFCGVFSSISLFKSNDFNNLFSYKGYKTNMIGMLYARKVNYDISKFEIDIGNKKHFEKKKLYQGLGSALSIRYSSDIKKIFSYILKVEPQYQNDCLEGLSYEIGENYEGNLEIFKILSHDKNISNTMPFILGLGQLGLNEYLISDEDFINIELNNYSLSYLYKGFGIAAASRTKGDFKKYINHAKFDKNYLKNFFQGYGYGLDWAVLSDLNSLINRIKQEEPIYFQDICYGIKEKIKILYGEEEILMNKIIQRSLCPN